MDSMHLYFQWYIVPKVIFPTNNENKWLDFSLQMHRVRNRVTFDQSRGCGHIVCVRDKPLQPRYVEMNVCPL